MPEILSRSKQETEEFKSRLDQGFGPDTTKDWFSSDETYSDDLLADQISTQTGALELAYAAPSYGEHPDGYSMYEEMLNEEPLLEAGKTEALLPAETPDLTHDELKNLEDKVNHSDYYELSAPQQPLENEDELVDRALPTAETVAPRTPRHAKEYHVEETPDVPASPESKDLSADIKEAERDLVTAAWDALTSQKTALAGGAEDSEARASLEAFDKKMRYYYDEGLDATIIESVGKLFREMYEIQSAAATKAVEVAPTVQPAVRESDALSPLTTDSRPITRSVPIDASRASLRVEKASMAEASDTMDLQDELDIDDEIENVAVNNETAPISAPVTEQVPVKGRMDTLKDSLSTIKHKTSEAFKPRIDGESIQRFSQGEFSGRKPLSVMVDGALEVDWSVANKLYNPLDRSYSYDVISRDGRSMNGVSEAQLIEWRDSDISAAIETPVVTAEQAKGQAVDTETPVQTEQAEASTQVAEETDTVKGPRHRADTSNSILKYGFDRTVENVDSLLSKTEWWQVNRKSIKNAWRPSYWAAKWNTMAVKEVEGWQGEGMTDQQKREFRRKRQTLGVAALAAGFITSAILINQGHDVNAVHAGIGWDGIPPKAPSPDSMPDVSTFAPSHHAAEHATTLLGNEPLDPGITHHVEAAFGAKDFLVPSGGSGEGLMKQLGLQQEEWFKIQDALLKQFPDEFYRMQDGNVGIVKEGVPSQGVQNFFNAHYGGKG